MHSFARRQELLVQVLISAWLMFGCGGDSKPKQIADASVVAEPAVWSMMGYDSSNNYYQPNEKKLTVDNANKLTEQWRFTIRGFPTGSPTIADGKVFVMATAGMYAIDLNTGEEVWSVLTIGGTASLAYADGFIYAHASGGAKLYKLDAADGSIVWGPVSTYPQLPRCDGTSSPIVAGGKVLVGHSCGSAEVTGGNDQTNARGGVEAFDIQDGSHLWTYWTVPEGGENGAMVWSTVSVDLGAKVVFAATGNNYTMGGGGSDAIHAIDLETGERKWLQQVRANDVWSSGSGITPLGEDTDFGANPILATVNGKKIVAAGDKGSSFWALDRETGEVLWSYAKMSSTHTQNNGGVLMNGAFDGKYFYVASNQPPGESILHVLDPKDGSDVLPTQKLGATVWGAPSLANGLLLVPANNVLRIFNAATGDKLTEFDTGGTIAAGSAAIVDGRIVVKSGLQYAFAADAMNNNQIICYGLGESVGPAADAGAVATGEPTFTGVYNDIIQGTGCAGSALCHAGDIGHLMMTTKQGTYDALVDVKAMGTNADKGSGPDCVDSGLFRVASGKPDDSLLVKKLEGTQPCGMPMPVGSKLSAAQIAQVRTWIKNGAHND
jgi:outer membrane protein assembly factor BamB